MALQLNWKLQEWSDEECSAPKGFAPAFTTARLQPCFEEALKVMCFACWRLSQGPIIMAVLHHPLTQLFEFWLHCEFDSEIICKFFVPLHWIVQS